MKIKNIYFLYVISFFFFIIFNSPKCYEYERFESIDAMEKYLKNTSNYFNDIKITKPNYYEHIYFMKKESIKLFSECKL